MSRRSFTIIELMLAIGIIGTIAGIVVAAINPTAQLASANDAKRQAAARELANAITQYEIDNGEVSTIPTDRSNALPVCREDVAGLSDCVEVGYVAPDYLIYLPEDGAENEPSRTGYSVYRDGPQIRAVSNHLGEDGGNISLVTRGLVGWWTFDDMSGTTATDLANGNNGTLSSMDPGTDWVSGTSSIQYTNTGALEFDSVNDNVLLNSPAELEITGDLTISSWIQTNNTTKTEMTIIGEWSGTVDRNYQFLLFAGQPRFIHGNGSTSTSYTAATNVADGNLHHIAFTASYPTYAFYVDGVEVRTGSMSYDIVPAGAVPGSVRRISGNPAYPNTLWDGLIDDFRMYDRTLSASEIARIASGNG